MATPPTGRKDRLTMSWLSDAPPRDPWAAREANGAMARTPIQERADRTTRLVRDITEAAAKERVAKVAKLRQARLEREAATPVAVPAPKKGRKA